MNVTLIPIDELNEILKSDLPKEELITVLNKKESYYSIQNGNTRKVKRTYPYWKFCTLCSTPFQTHTPEQATRNKYCSKDCIGKVISETNSGKKQDKIQCPVCKEMFYPKFQSQNRPRVNCSNKCNGIERGEEWKTHAHKGRLQWTKESEEKHKNRMTGKNNPSWTGGVTYIKRKGRYANQSIKCVRCPKEFIGMARNDGYVTEHRLKVAIQIGRPLTRVECVHHINHNAEDNRIENLMLFANNSEHKKYEHGQDVKPIWEYTKTNRQ